MITTPRGLRAVCLFLIGAAGFAAAADPFYERLLRDGSSAYNRRDYQTAVRLFRVACFGLLEEPEALADGLVRLGLSQAAAGDADGFRDTFQRLVEVEDRFQGYTRAATPKEMREAYEKFVVSNVPGATLVSSPSFARLVPKPEERLARLSARELRSELEKLLAAEPKEPKWHLMASSAALKEGDTDTAREQADAVLALSPGNKEALRLRGLALARDKKWAQASADLKASGAATTDPQAAESLLRCLVQLELWQDATALAAQFPPSIRKQSAIVELAGRADAELAKAKAAAAKPTLAPTRRATEKPSPKPTAAKTTATPTRTATPRPTTKPATPTATPRPTSTAPPAPAPKVSPTVVSLTSPPMPFGDELARAEELAAQDRLAEAFAVAQGVADAHPESAEAQHATAEIAYRGARWADSVAYFRRGGDPGVTQPLRLFYFAVALYEYGDRPNAAATLQRCLPRIKNTGYVEQYRRKILGQ
ncbi:MAG: CDC27 family protein [Acidobacteria bacterium]|nr:CDC27 family protein [Acidobacteriota bacterium]